MTHTVVVAGWGQVTQPKQLDVPRKDPMGLMAQAARRAAQTLSDPSLLCRIDGLMVVKSLSAHYPDPAGQLAAALNCSPRFKHLSRIGGNSPQTLVNKAAGMIARGEVDTILVAGAEAYVTPNPESAGIDSVLLQGIPADYQGDDVTGTCPLENRHGIEHPMQGFPLFETALWAASGLEITPYLEQVAALWSRFSQVAASHDYAWNKKAKTLEQILTPGPHNRPIAFPYTKFMNAFVTVDQGAAIILMSETTAKKYQNPGLAPVYFCGGGYAQDRQRFMIEKSDFTQSPPLKTAVDKALNRSGLTLDQVDLFDLYSCFPCAVAIAQKMLNLGENDPRPLTLTGGLGFFGGPGNNYNLHAIATLAEKIAQGKTRTGLVTALGWFMHKHAAGIYSCVRPEKSLETMDLEDEKDFLAGKDPVAVDNAPEGTGVIETYTVVYARDGSPAYGVIYGRTEKGLRFIARPPEDPDLFKALTTRNQVGQRVSLKKDTEKQQTLARF